MASTRGVVDINLLPSAQGRAGFTFDRIFAVGLALLAAELAGVLLFDIFENIQINRLNTDISAWTQRVAVEQEQVREVDDLRDQVTQLRAKADQLERVKQSPLQAAEILKDIGNVTPHGMWFSSINVAHPTDGGSVTLVGDTSTYREVADLMLNIDGSPIFGDAVLTTSTQQILPNNTSGGDVQFSVLSALSPAVIGTGQ